MSYELWDTEARNIVEVFETEAEALVAVRELVALNAPAYPGALALAVEDEAGETAIIAQGEQLAARARQVR
jgi:hypothetical protein